MQLSRPLLNLKQSDRSAHNRRFSKVGRLSCCGILVILERISLSNGFDMVERLKIGL